MKILLAHNSPYYPSHGGGDRSNRLLMEALAARGHHCRVVARTGAHGSKAQEDLVRELSARGVPVLSSGSGVLLMRLNGVEVHIAANHPNLREYFSGQLASFAPEIVIASTDDPAQLMLEAALRHQGPRIVYLARATLPLPFGPDCAFPSVAKAASLRLADSLVGVSEYVANYIGRWGGAEALHVPISLLEPGPWPVCGSFDNEFVTMVNPSATKGIAIFLALAQAMPGVKFAAVPSWGTNAEDLAKLQRRAQRRDSRSGGRHRGNSRAVARGADPVAMGGGALADGDRIAAARGSGARKRRRRPRRGDDGRAVFAPGPSHRQIQREAR